MNIRDKKVKISEECLVQKMGDGLVVMDLGSEHFYELDEVGKRFWELLSANENIKEAIDILYGEYDVSAGILEKDMEHLIESLVKARLIVVSDV